MAESSATSPALPLSCDPTCPARMVARYYGGEQAMPQVRCIANLAVARLVGHAPHIPEDEAFACGLEIDDADLGIRGDE